MKCKIYLLVFLIFQNFSLFSQVEWELSNDKDEIKVYSRKEGNHKFKAFKAMVTVESSIQNFIATLQNIDLFPQWGHNIENAELLKREGDTLQIYYSVAEVSFPYKNRDGIYLNRFKWNSRTKALKVDIEILNDYLELNEKYTRVKGYGYWDVKVLSSNRIEIIFYMQIDPGGNIPSWLANRFVDNSPYYTLLNLKNILEKSKTEIEYSFID